MTLNEILSLPAGFLFISLLGSVHLAGLRLIRLVLPDHKRKPNLGVILTFSGLALLHLIEIALCALTLYTTQAFPRIATLNPQFEESLADHFYYAGMAFTSLGHSQIDATGAVRLLTMMISLAGFMLITWSATFIYTVWGERFRRE